MPSIFRRSFLGLVLAALLAAGCKKPYTPPPPSSKYVQTVDLDSIRNTAMAAAGIEANWQSNGTSKSGGGGGDTTSMRLQFHGDFTTAKVFTNSAAPAADKQIALMNSIRDQFKAGLKSADLVFVKADETFTPGSPMKIVIHYTGKKDSDYDISGKITISLNPGQQSNLKIEVNETATNP